MLSLIEQNDGCVPQEKLKCVRQVVEEGGQHLLVKRQSITLVDPWWDASVIHPGRGVNNMLDHIDFLRPVRFHLSKLRFGSLALLSRVQLTEKSRQAGFQWKCRRCFLNPHTLQPFSFTL